MKNIDEKGVAFLMINNCYNFEELKTKFNWTTTLNEISKQITFARRRGVEIKPAFKKGRTYFEIISADSYPDEIWQIHPNKDLYLEVSNLGRVRDILSKAYLGYEDSNKYIILKRYGI